MCMIAPKQQISLVQVNNKMCLNHSFIKCLSALTWSDLKQRPKEEFKNKSFFSFVMH